MQAVTHTTFCFGEFELDADRRLLSKRDETVPLHSKTLDLLLALVENHGRVLSKNDLLDKVWENQFVEENNLTVHVAALRKALGETKNEHRFIVTVPGKGYRFVAEVNGGANGEIVVERHKFERIVVEEEFEERSREFALNTANVGAGLAKQNSFAPRHVGAASATQTLVGWIREHQVASVAAMTLIVLIGVGSGYVFRSRLSANFAAAAPFGEHRIRQLTTNGKVGGAALSPDGKLFAYTIDDVGQKSLWLGHVGGGNHLLLRPPAEVVYQTLAFSTDNSHLYFSIRDEINPKGALYKIPVPGGVQTKLLDEIGNFSLSPDGTHIAIARRDAEQQKDFIIVTPLDGSQGREVASFPRAQSFVFSTISWSPDATRLVVSAVKKGLLSIHELAVVEILSGSVTRLNVENWREITKTAWLRDGSGIIITALGEKSNSSVPQYEIVHVAYPSGDARVVTADRSNYGASWHNDAGVTLSLSAVSDSLLTVEHRQLANVWVAPSDNLAAARQITHSSFGKYDGLWGMDWTPDGKLIYTTSDTRSQFLAQMNGDGGAQQAITAPGGIDSQPVVTADGRYVLFHSKRGSEMDIWRADTDGTNAVQLTFGGKAFHPAASPDGRWVYYKSFLSGIGELSRVPIDGGVAESLNDKQTSWGSFSPDGRYFAASYITDKQRLAIFSAETNEIIKQFDLPKNGTLYMGSHWKPDSTAVAFRDNAHGYWLQPIDGGAPTKMEGLPKEKFYNFAWSRDGKWFAFVRSQEIRDVVLIENSNR